MPRAAELPGSATGRAVPSAAGFHTSQVFFTDDTGCYLLPTRDQPPREFDTLEDRISHTADSYVRLSDSRLQLPREEPYMEGHNTWIGNHPGSLLAFAVADLAEHLLENLWFFAANGYPIRDDINGRQIPGAQPFSGLAHADDPIPLSFVEQYTLTEASAELSIAAHNGALGLQAMGLGGWIFDGLDRLSVLGGSGIRGRPAWVSSPTPTRAGRSRMSPGCPATSRRSARRMSRRCPMAWPSWWPESSAPAGRRIPIRRVRGRTVQACAGRRCRRTASPNWSPPRRPTSTTPSASCPAPCRPCTC